MLTEVYKINLLCHQLEFSACTLSFPVFKRRGSTDLVVGGGGGGAAPSRRAVDWRRERVATRPDDPAAARTAAARQQALHLLAVQRLLLQDRLALGADWSGRLSQRRRSSSSASVVIVVVASPCSIANDLVLEPSPPAVSRRVDHGSGPSAGQVGPGPEKSDPWSTLVSRTRDTYTDRQRCGRRGNEDV